MSIETAFRPLISRKRTTTVRRPVDRCEREGEETHALAVEQTNERTHGIDKFNVERILDNFINKRFTRL